MLLSPGMATENTLTEINNGATAIESLAKKTQKNPPMEREVLFMNNERC